MLSLAAPKFTSGDCSFCEYTYPNGQKYVGSWKNNYPHGAGTQTGPDGTMYTGSFKNGKQDGAGTLALPTGEMYVGSFKNNKRNGTGTNTWPTGEKYVGSWKNDKRHGTGTQTYPNGQMYSGSFKNDKQFENSIQRAQDEAKAQGDCRTWEDGSSTRNGFPVASCEGNNIQNNQQSEMQSIQQAQEEANAHFAEIQRQNAAAQRRYQAELASYRKELANAEKARERARKDAVNMKMIELGLGIASGKYDSRVNSYRAPTIQAPAPPPLNPYSRYRMNFPDNSYVDCTYNSQTRNADCY